MNAAGNDENATTSHAAADSSYPDLKLRRIAFGSCHSGGAFDRRRSTTADLSSSSSSSPATIWDAMASTVRPQAFLWTGDAVYPPREIKGDAPLDAMREEYRRMLLDEDLGYARFLRGYDISTGGGVHGTWDDHDYGGNDRGREMTDREGRRDAYLEFLDVRRDSARWERGGVYSSVDFGLGDSNAAEDGGSDGGVRVIFLDTRWHRERHCIPSVASNPRVPYGSLVACVTRWVTAGLNLPSFLPTWTSCSEDSGLLGDDQWNWLEMQLKNSKASMHVVVSSIQVLTTNPVIESWGHFPSERVRLLRLLNNVPGLTILSGDVHHAEIISTKTQDVEGGVAANRGAFVEVTSSGLTHSCDEPFYGSLCKPILDAFPAHRAKGGNAKNVESPSYFTSRNFGSIEIDWVSRTFQVRVHDATGDVVLSTAFEMSAVANMSEGEIQDVSKCIDGHIWPFLRRVAPFHAAGIICVCVLYLYLFRPNSEREKTTKNVTKSKRV